MEKIILTLKEILKHNIPVSIEYDYLLDRFEYIIEGFYKSGSIRIYEDCDYMLATSRYNQLDEIENIEDLVKLNYRWWKNSQDRYEGWKNPDFRWIPLLEKYGLIEKEENIVVTYK